MDTNINAGDWVRTCHAGIWRVIRTVPDHFKPRTTLLATKELYEGPLFVVKRLVNDKWKMALDVISVHGSLVRRLNKSDAKKLSAYLSENPDEMIKFEAFNHPQVFLWNIGFALKRKSAIHELHDEVATAIGDISAGVGPDVVLRAIASSSFANCCSDGPQSASLQFVNSDYEISRRELIFRKMNALKF